MTLEGLTMRILTTCRAACFGGLVVLVGLTPAAQARQTSLDSQIFKAFERIDDRTTNHEQNVVAAQAALAKISAKIEQLRQKLAEMSTDSSDPDLRKSRRNLHGQMINLSAEYLNQSFKLVDSAAAVISANLSDLAKLATQVRNSTDPTGGAIKLQNRIKANIAAGRSMRMALVQIQNWAGQDPTMIGRFQSLRRIAMILDRKISVDKARLKSRHMDSSGAIRNKRLEVLDQSVDQLGNMYAEISAEKDALRDLRDELRMVIQLSRLELTQEVASRAIPRVDGINGPTTGVNSLKDMAVIITDLNESLVTEINTAQPVVVGTGPVQSKPAGLEISGFSNF